MVTDLVWQEIRRRRWWRIVTANYNLRRGSMLSFERSLDQHHRRRACPEFVADRAMVLKLTMGSKSEFL